MTYMLFNVVEDPHYAGYGVNAQRNHLRGFVHMKPPVGTPRRRTRFFPDN